VSAQAEKPKSPPFGMVPRALRDSGLSAHLSWVAISVYTALSWYADTDRDAWPSNERLAADLGSLANVIVRGLKELVAAKAITRSGHGKERIFNLPMDGLQAPKPLPPGSKRTRDERGQFRSRTTPHDGVVRTAQKQTTPYDGSRATPRPGVETTPSHGGENIPRTNQEHPTFRLKPPKMVSIGASAAKTPLRDPVKKSAPERPMSPDEQRAGLRDLIETAMSRKRKL
jgi:hypothetical protein